MHVALVGAGVVGARAARQLAQMPGVSKLSIIDREPDRARAVAAAIGAPAHGIEADDPSACEGAEAILVALPPVADETVCLWAIAQGIPVVSVGADPHTVDAILDSGRTGNAPVVVGAGALPGLTDVLVRHAAGLFDSIDDIRVAGAGIAGPTSVNVHRSALTQPLQIREGQLVSVRPGVSQVGWFPEPIGERECVRSPFSVRLLQRSFPEVPSITVWTEEPARRRRDDWGGARVEVWGMRGGRHATVVYGFAERIPAVGAVVGSVTLGAVVGLLPEVRLKSSGNVGGVSEWVVPTAMLAECARRGITVAAFGEERGH
ncbi:MAG: saccharopine dehydrogenase NADP-binding domain-containing protein [Acidimicrobiia bacterium]